MVGKLQRTTGVPAWLERAAALAWRLLVVSAAVIGVLWLLGQLWVAALAVFVATLLVRVLAPPAAWLRRHGWPSGFAAAATIAGLLGAISLAGTVVAVAVADDADQIGPAVATAIDDVERWIGDRRVFGLDRADVAAIRSDIEEAAGGWLRSGEGPLLSGAVQVVEALSALLLALILTVFGLVEGERWVAWVRLRAPGDRRLLDRVGARAWAALGGYLRGAMTLGIVEGVVIALALQLVGAELALPIGIVTFLAAFVPFVGAVVAGALATLVALSTADLTGALIVLAVAVAVQQLDNDLLAPLVYGRNVNMHPVWVLLAIVAGSALFGVPGTIAAVPLMAVAVNVVAETLAFHAEREDSQSTPESPDQRATDMTTSRGPGG